MRELLQRGFQVIQEDDPIFLRRRVEEARPFSQAQPLLVITSGALEDLPYDIYQAAYLLKLSLNRFYPYLAYPLLQMLSPDQIEKLETCTQPVETLSRQKTIDYLLREVFSADTFSLSRPHALLSWLTDYHQRQSPLPEALRLALVERLKRYPVYQGWDLDLLIQDVQGFSEFMQKQWQTSLAQTLSGDHANESGGDYGVSFDRDPFLQDLLPLLVRRGAIRPLEVADISPIPAWAQPGVTRVDGRLQRFHTLLQEADRQLQALVSVGQTRQSWIGWDEFARTWAELCAMRDHSDLSIEDEAKQILHWLSVQVDRFFPAWLKQNYTLLGVQRLPKPRHVFHIPHYLAYLRELGQCDRLALFVLDGLSLADWQTVKTAWANRHAGWKIHTEPLLAQVPTVTAISRYALISGLRPLDFANDLEHPPSEGRAWELFWSRTGTAQTACKLDSLSYDRGVDQQPDLLDERVHFWCLIDDTPDRLAHHASLGAADQQASLKLWLDPDHPQNSTPLEEMIESFLERGFSVFIASDHGHVEATGFGQPFEGLLAQTRGKRARIYLDRLAALRVQDSFAQTILWEIDGLLPANLAVLMPEGKAAFAPSGEVVVTHGGISLEEVVVPFVQISKASA